MKALPSSGCMTASPQGPVVHARPKLPCPDSAGMWATPTKQDAANLAGPSQMGRHSLSLNAQVGGRVGSNFAAALMGWMVWD